MGKKLILFTSLILLLSAAGAADTMEIEEDDGTTQTDVTFTLTDLGFNVDYRIRMARSDGSGNETITSFNSGGTGKAERTVPIDFSRFKIQDSGEHAGSWLFFLQRFNTLTQEWVTTLSQPFTYGLHVTTFKADHFDDIENDHFWDCGGTKTASDSIMTCTSDGTNVRIKPRFFHSVEHVEKFNSTDVTCDGTCALQVEEKSGNKEKLLAGNQGQGFSNANITGAFTVYYNDSSNRYEIFNLTSGEKSKFHSSETDGEEWRIEYDIRSGNKASDISFDQWAVYEAASNRIENTLITGYPYECDVGICNWVSETLDFTGQSISTSFETGTDSDILLENIGDSKSIDTFYEYSGNLSDSNITYHHVFYRGGNLWTVHEPEDDTTQTTPVNVKFNYNFSGQVYPQVAADVIVNRPSGTQTFTDPFEHPCMAGVYFRSQCVGENISADIDMPPDTQSWFIRFHIIVSSNANLAGETLDTETRDIQVTSPRTRLELLEPLNNSVLLTTSPRFTGLLSTTVEGVFAFCVDGNKNKSLQSQCQFASKINGVPFTDTITWDLSDSAQSLSEGEHQVYAAFKQGTMRGTGFRVFSDTVNFTINTSRSTDVNFSLDSPADGASTTSDDVTLEYEIETSTSGSGGVWLNNDQVGTHQFTGAGTFSNLSTEVSNLDAGQYAWFLTFNDTGANILFQSQGSSFSVNERVSITDNKPREGASVKSVPVVFSADVTASHGGQFQLFVDGELRESRDLPANFSDTISIEIGDLSAGKHTYEMVLRSTEGVERTPIVTFELLQGVEDAPAGVVQEGGVKDFVEAVQDLLGLNQEQALILISFLFIAPFAGLGFWLGGGVGGIAMILFGNIMFGLMDWMPKWIWFIIVPVAIISWALIGKEAVGNG